MDGQWLGQATGTNNGNVLLDLDDMGTYVEGHAHFFDTTPGVPQVLAAIRTRDKNPKQNLTVPIEPMSALTGQLLTAQQAAAQYPGATFPTTAQLSLQVNGPVMNLTWSTTVSNGTAQLTLSQAAFPSAYAGQVNVSSWDQFKKHVLSLTPERFIFRGQKDARRLRTAFHRTRRKDLVKFVRQDIPAIRRVLASRPSSLFDTANPEQYAALLSLIQHHGYPTPLLDWSYSPFVAAFFAYQGFSHFPGEHKSVRIFAFDRAEWLALRQFNLITFAPPHLSVVEPLYYENPRGGPQQALSTVTNIDDIESYVHRMEVQSGKQFLRVFDLPSHEAKDAMRELRLMGIHSGSMFPGIQGECEGLKSRLFDLI